MAARDRSVDDIRPDEPVPLAEACRLFFGGYITPATLRKEGQRGKIVLLRIANKHFVTPNAIKEMLNECQEPRNPLASSSERTSRPKPTAPPESSLRVGSSETDPNSYGPEHLREMLRKRNKRSESTSARSTTRSTETAKLLPFQSSTS
jgi:hypothetical protein